MSAEFNPWDEKPVQVNQNVVKKKTFRTSSSLAAKLKANILPNDLKREVKINNSHRAHFLTKMQLAGDCSTSMEPFVPWSPISQPMYSKMSEIVSPDSKRSESIAYQTQMCKGKENLPPDEVFNPNLVSSKLTISESKDAESSEYLAPQVLDNQSSFSTIEISSISKPIETHKSPSIKIPVQRETIVPVVRKVGSFMKSKVKFDDLELNYSNSRTDQNAYQDVIPRIPYNKATCLESPTKCPTQELFTSLLSVPSATVSAAVSSSPHPKHSSCFASSNSATLQRRPLMNKSKGNYLKLNLRKKCFSRGGTNRQNKVRFQMKKNKFYKKFGSKFSGGSEGFKGGKKGICFKCNREGHWANKCPMTIGAQKDETRHVDVNAMELDFTPSIWNIADLDKLKQQFPGPNVDELTNTPLEDEMHNLSPIIQPTSSPEKFKEVDAFIKNTLIQLGIKHFRPGQEQAVWRTLAGRSTLLVLPTAGGKSLCYQIPAAIYQKYQAPATALIISPLISLMQDQVVSLTSPIQGAYLSSSQKKEEKEEILTNARNGKYAYLLMSPEALVESEWMLRSNRLPPISFVCIDEAHCLADWSHHFRPSYLRVCSLLKRRLSVTCFLGLSATCTPSSISNICHNMSINKAVLLDSHTSPIDTLLTIPNSYSQVFPPSDGYLQPVFNPLPPNLLVTASMEVNREEALIQLLQRPPFSEQLSILVYAASRDLTERLASFVRTAMQTIKQKIGRRTVGWNTAVYHAGLTSKERARAQKNFMAGSIRLLVATTAFGMGLNKKNLQAVIHFSMPKSFENYVQEIGRVGRTGQQSYCHAFLPPGISENPCEANEIRRHIFANHIDLAMLKRLLRLIYAPCESCNRPDECCGHVVSMDPEQIADELDIKPESLATILSYLHLQADEQRTLTMLQPSPRTVTISCYGGPTELARVSNRSLAVSAWLGILQSKHPNFDELLPSLREIKLDLVWLCNAYGWRPDTIRGELQHLEWDAKVDCGPHRTGVSVSTGNWVVWNWIHGKLISERLDGQLTYLWKRLKDVENASVDSLVKLQKAIGMVAVKSSANLDFAAEDTEARSKLFHLRVADNFMEKVNDKEEIVVDPTWPLPITPQKEAGVRGTISDFLQLHGHGLDGQITGRILANIFHGIGSPQFPALSWSRAHRFWRCLLDVDWPTLQRIATEELIQSAYV